MVDGQAFGKRCVLIRLLGFDSTSRSASICDAFPVQETDVDLNVGVFRLRHWSLWSALWRQSSTPPLTSVWSGHVAFLKPTTATRSNSFFSTFLQTRWGFIDVVGIALCYSMWQALLSAVSLRCVCECVRACAHARTHACVYACAREDLSA